VHRSEVLANLKEVVKGLFGFVQRGELTALLLKDPRDEPLSRRAQKRLSPAEVDQLVADYRAGECSIYDLADRYGVHRNTIAQHLKGRGFRLGLLPLQELEAARARELHARGLSLNAIGRTLGRDPKTIKVALSNSQVNVT
jgi:DNA-binding CsgD family transcriptional regulator